MVNVTTDKDSGSLMTFSHDGERTVYNQGDLAWILASMALIWIMIPGVGFFYGGLLRRKNALSMIYLSIMTITVVSFQWFFWGFSLVFSETKNGFIGDLRYFGLRGVLEKPSIASPAIPSILFCAYQLMFAAFTPMIAIGAVAERGRIAPLMVFVFVWSTLVYDPIAYWVWNPNGWSARLPSLDFAGGTPVHIASGATALAITIHMGKRSGFGTDVLRYSANNVSYVVLGTSLMWFGWFGFNGGSALSANFRACNAVVVTNLAASVGGLTYAFWDCIWRPNARWGMVNICSGAISGLIAITPAAGFVGAPAAVLIGAVAAVACYFAADLLYWFQVDDLMDIGAFHIVGGFVGNILTGIFAQASIAGSDGRTSIKGGWLDHHFIQVAYQLADSAAGGSYAFFATTIILFVMKHIPGLSLRVDREVEEVGIDLAEMGDNFDNFDHFNDIVLRVGALEAGQVRARTVKAWTVEDGVDPTQNDNNLPTEQVHVDQQIPMQAMEGSESSRHYRRDAHDY